MNTTNTILFFPNCLIRYNPSYIHLHKKYTHLSIHTHLRRNTVVLLAQKLLVVHLHGQAAGKIQDTQLTINKKCCFRDHAADALTLPLSDIINAVLKRKKLAFGQRRHMAVRSLLNSTAASSTVRLAVKSLPGANRQTASGIRGRTAFSTSVLSCAAEAPGVDMKPKDILPSGISTNPSTIARRWEAPTIRTNCNREIF